MSALADPRGKHDSAGESEQIGFKDPMKLLNRRGLPATYLDGHTVQTFQANPE